MIWKHKLWQPISYLRFHTILQYMDWVIHNTFKDIIFYDHQTAVLQDRGSFELLNNYLGWESENPKHDKRYFRLPQ